jgi:hypothetical protein
VHAFPKWLSPEPKWEKLAAHEMGQPMEMRKEMRYRMDASALFSWENKHKDRFRGKGVTRDISGFGAFILTPACPPVNVPIQVEVVLPSLTGLKPVIRVSGVARVLRVEHKSDGKREDGFAVVSEDFAQWNLARIKEESAPASKGVLAGMGNPGRLQAQRA